MRHYWALRTLLAKKLALSPNASFLFLFKSSPPTPPPTHPCTHGSRCPSRHSPLKDPYRGFGLSGSLAALLPPKSSPQYIQSQRLLHPRKGMVNITCFTQVLAIMSRWNLSAFQKNDIEEKISNIFLPCLAITSVLKHSHTQIPEWQVLCLCRLVSLLSPNGAFYASA